MEIIIFQHSEGVKHSFSCVKSFVDDPLSYLFITFSSKPVAALCTLWRLFYLKIEIYIFLKVCLRLLILCILKNASENDGEN